MSFRVVEDDPSFPVKPDQIDPSQSFRYAFDEGDDTPAHRIAKAIVQFCRNKGGWTSFTLEDLILKLGGAGDLSEDLGGLREPGYVWKQGEPVPITKGWIVAGEDGRYRVVSDFIFRCLGRAAAPVRNPAPSY